MAALLMLREVREELAGWESALIETARGEGASWAGLAGPLGVGSRQAAERRHLRLRPGTLAGISGLHGETHRGLPRDGRRPNHAVGLAASSGVERAGERYLLFG
ncbi:hypothetical protein ACF087_36550 [Streptomyces goshikiensis]|uniref:hypothetical protein n=1 Tax=Streptomyces goshikiensis TaxID=1942 RepID=UPI0036F599D6